MTGEYDMRGPGWLDKLTAWVRGWRERRERRRLARAAFENHVMGREQGDF